MKLCTLLLLGLSLAGIQAQTLYILEKTGTQTPFALANVKTITFTGNNLHVYKKDGSISSTPLLSIQYLSFLPITGIFTPETETTSTLMLYPNPVQDVLNVAYQANDIKAVIQIEVLSIDGRVIYTESYDSQKSTLHTINVSEWQRGLYLVRINNGTELITKKIIKN
jgi:hypothetical protein